MLGTAASLARDSAVPVTQYTTFTPVEQPSRRARKSIVLMAAGLLVSSVAAGVGLLHGGRSAAPAGPAAPAAQAASASSAPGHGNRAIALVPSDFAVVAITYDPGQSSGWHVHPGIHAVHVLSGTLSIYDENCGVQTVGPDQSYVGGRDTHLARNEGAEPVRMVVTYVEPGNTAPADLSFRVPAPAGCPA